jgi:hypothetical protein
LHLRIIILKYLSHKSLTLDRKTNLTIVQMFITFIFRSNASRSDDVESDDQPDGSKLRPNDLLQRRQSAARNPAHATSRHQHKFCWRNIEQRADHDDDGTRSGTCVIVHSGVFQNLGVCLSYKRSHIVYT